MALSPKIKKLRNKACSLCPLHEKASRVCIMGTGSFKKKVFIVGEAPGFQEDKVGRPFIGAAGKLLRSELLRVGVNPESCYITNTVKCFPDGTPTEEEADICSRNYLRKEIEVLKPDFILALGSTAMKVLTRGEKISEARGQVWESKIGDCFVFPTFHPAFILRNRKQMATFQNDLDDFAILITL